MALALNGHPMTGPVLHIPLAWAALCLDCQAVFREPARDGEHCPACASRNWVLLSKFLKLFDE
jgi:Zn finger protein HypA/HybF involved in hydrogenase expression